MLSADSEVIIDLAALAQSTQNSGTQNRRAYRFRVIWDHLGYIIILGVSALFIINFSTIVSFLRWLVGDFFDSNKTYLEELGGIILLIGMSVFLVLCMLMCLRLYSNFKAISADNTLTLSLKTQTLHLKRSGWPSSDVILPLQEILSFSNQTVTALRNTTHQSHYLIAHTTGHILLLDPSTSDVNPYSSVVPRLNQFLADSRQSNYTPMPYTPLTDLPHYMFPLTNASPAVTSLPSLSRMSFHEINETSFECSKQTGFPIYAFYRDRILLFAGILPVVMNALIQFSHRGESLPDSLKGKLLHLNFFFALICVAGSYVWFLKHCPLTLIFTRQGSEPSGKLRIWYWMRNVRHVPITKHNKVLVEQVICPSGTPRLNSWVLALCGRAQSYDVGWNSSGFWQNRFKPLPKVRAGVLFNVHLLTDEGERLILPGFTEGEILCLTYWLQQRFPLLSEDMSNEELERLCFVYWVRHRFPSFLAEETLLNSWLKQRLPLLFEEEANAESGGDSSLSSATPLVETEVDRSLFQTAIMSLVSRLRSSGRIGK